MCVNEEVPARYVDAITVSTSFFFNHIAKIDADAKYHFALFGKLLVAFGQLPLDLNSALHRIHNRGEFGQQVIARGINHTTPTLLYEGGHGLFVCRQGMDGTGLIITHKATVAFNIGIENCSEFAFQTFFRHSFVQHFQVENERERNASGVTKYYK